jgi:hypothetical protein
MSDSGNAERLVDEPDNEKIVEQAEAAPLKDIKHEDGAEDEGFYEDEGSRMSGEEPDEEMKDEVPATSEEAHTKKKFDISKLCSCLSRARKIHVFRDNRDDDSVGSVFDARPPLPPNMPIADDMRKRLEYRNEKVRYGKEKIEYYIEVSILMT